MMRKLIGVLFGFVLLLLAVQGFCQLPASSRKSAVMSELNVQGTVVDQDGKPIAKAKISVMRHSQKDAKTITFLSDKNGKFKRVLQMDQRGNSVTLIAVAERYSYGYAWYNGNSKDLKITLYPGYKLKIKVIDENKKPLAGAKVRMNHCYAYGSNKNVNIQLPEDKQEAATDKNGILVIDHMVNPEGFEYMGLSMAVSMPGRALIGLNIQKQDILNGIVVTDPLECKLDGTLYLPNKTGTAPENILVMVQVGMNPGESLSRGVSTNKDGKFHFEQLPPGKVNVMLAASHGRRYGSDGTPQKAEVSSWALPAVMGLELLPKETKTLDLVMVPGALVKGKVVDSSSGKPLSGAFLNIYHDGRPKGTFPENVSTDENGEFEFRSAAGNVSIQVTHIGNGPDQIYYPDDDCPKASIIVADGEVKTDVVIKAGKSTRNRYDVGSKEVPLDFELIPGVYDLTWNPDIEINGSYCEYEDKDTLSRIKVMPKMVSSNPKAMAFPVDGAGDNGLLFVVLDESEGTGKGWNTAYIDLNRNGDLTDDKPITFSLPASEDYSQAHTDWMTMQAHQGVSGSETTQHPMQVKLDINSYKDNIDVQLSRKGTWTGIIDSNKGKVECATIDINNNATFGDLPTFNDKFELDTQGDELYIDTNGYGSVVPQYFSPHRIPLYNVTKAVKKFYQIKVNDLGNKVSVEPYKGEYGQFEVRGENIEGLKADAEDLYVIGGPGAFSSLVKDGKPIPLPVGKYVVSNCKMMLKAKDKNSLLISCSDSSDFDVSANKLSSVLISGKLSLAISPEIKNMVFTPGNTETITWSIKIGNKTVVDSIGDNDRSNPPKVKFYNKNGKLIHTTIAGYT